MHDQFVNYSLDTILKYVETQKEQAISSPDCVPPFEMQFKDLIQEIAHIEEAFASENDTTLIDSAQRETNLLQLYRIRISQQRFRSCPNDELLHRKYS